MNSKFIRVNKRILDLKEYGKKVVLIKHYLMHHLKEELTVNGFEPQQNLTFYHKALDLELKITIKKRSKMVFV